MQAERYASLAARRNGRVQFPRALCAAAAALCMLFGAAAPAAAQALQRIRDTGQIRLGYLAEARPFSYRGEDGKPEGYAIELCQHIVRQLEQQFALPGLKAVWKVVDFDGRLNEVQQGNIDILCAPTSMTLGRREEVSFSMPIFGGGNRAVVRANASTPLRNVLSEHPSTHPVWRGSPAATVLQGTSVGTVAGTTTEKWLQSRRAALQIDATVVPVRDYRSGLMELLDGKLDVFFGERTLVLGALASMDRSAREGVVILDRMFTHEPVALALPRGDDDLRLAVDRALSRLYPSDEFAALYTKCCGELDEQARAFFVWNTLGE